MRFTPILLILIGLASALRGSPRCHAQEPPSFTRDVQPILAANCFACHGPDDQARAADLALHTRDAATADLSDNTRAIVPGDPDRSALIRRITAEEESERMPPRETGKTLSAEQVDTLTRWIAAGANYEKHWAFVPPTKPPLPVVTDASWPRNGIDHFVLARLEQQGLTPAPRADRYALVRRVYLDLIGLPPTPAQADAFVNNHAPDAYEQLVDELLASPHYGERWARPWLDLARYADTNGYEKDRPRSIWPYRDWVIRALNDDMPFDRFSIEQLAGDMLPGATTEQRIATGFHRNTMLNEEGGIDPLEYRFYAMVDRVATTGTIWLALTTGCAQCHSHKYDPISHTDYFRLMALLNNADEPDLAVPDPAIDRERTQLFARIAKLEAELPKHFPPVPGDEPVAQRREANLRHHFEAWLEEQRPGATVWRTIRPTAMSSNLPRLEQLNDGSILSTGDITKRDVYTLAFEIESAQLPIRAVRLMALPDDRLPASGPGRTYFEGRKGEFFLSELTARHNNRPVQFTNASHNYGRISIGSGTADAANVLDGEGSTGWSTAHREGEAHQLVVNLEKPIETPGTLRIELLFERHYPASLGRFRIDVTDATSRPIFASALPENIEAILASSPSQWSDADRQSLFDHYLLHAPQLAEARKPIDELRKQLPDFPTTLIMRERPADNPRPTFRYHRGDYLQPRERVSPGLPALFAGTSADAPTKRLELARWLVSDRNPLAARAAVNRAWQAFFGVGIVSTPDDFGTQGATPTHPQLLDYLARVFVEQGWSKKKLHRLIVTSATYRQRSHITPQLLQVDPENRQLARGARFRVDAEMVRDIALCASGVFEPEIGGPSVFPPQPESVTALAYGGFAWQSSNDTQRYRRSLYTFAKRTAPFAAYAVFDAPTGENCIARRNRSNTPLAALTLLNDPMFTEFAVASAERVLEVDEPARERAAVLFRHWLTRPPTQEELHAIERFYDNQYARLHAGALDAATITGRKQASDELAAWTMAARAIMNLDETITKP